MSMVRRILKTNIERALCVQFYCESFAMMHDQQNSRFPIRSSAKVSYSEMDCVNVPSLKYVSYWKRWKLKLNIGQR